MRADDKAAGQARRLLIGHCPPRCQRRSRSGALCACLSALPAASLAPAVFDGRCASCGAGWPALRCGACPGFGWFWHVGHFGTPVRHVDARIDCACAQGAPEGLCTRQDAVIPAVTWVTARPALPVVKPAGAQRTMRTPSPLGTVSW